MGTAQPDLFSAPDPRARLEREHAECAALAAKLPARLRMGSSSWSFPGWAGFVWSAQRSESWLAKHGLAEYARHPLLTTVGIDRGFYAPIPERDLEAYAAQLPPGFPCCTKAPAAVVSAAILDPRPGQERGAPNPHFLDAARLRAEMLDRFERKFSGHSGPFLLQFPPIPRQLGLTPAEFAERLDAFLAALPRRFRYAVELRTAGYVTPEYRETLARHGASHVYNYAAWMPSLAAQERQVPLDNAPFVTLRLLLRPGTGYAARKDLFEPFDRLQDPDLDMRADVTSIVGRASQARRDVFVLVNNKAEGSAPLTIRALAESLVQGATP